MDYNIAVICKVFESKHVNVVAVVEGKSKKSFYSYYVYVLDDVENKNVAIFES